METENKNRNSVSIPFLGDVSLPSELSARTRLVTLDGRAFDRDHGGDWFETKGAQKFIKRGSSSALALDNAYALLIESVMTIGDALPPISSFAGVSAAATDTGYEMLSGVLNRAFEQASNGKGKARHVVGNEPFHEQVILKGARHFGVGSLLFQAFKKMEEAQRLPTEAAAKELLGAIVYLAGAVIAIEELSE